MTKTTKKSVKTQTKAPGYGWDNPDTIARMRQMEADMIEHTKVKVPTVVVIQNADTETNIDQAVMFLEPGDSTEQAKRRASDNGIPEPEIILTIPLSHDFHFGDDVRTMYCYSG